MRTLGWPHPVRQAPWSEIEEHFVRAGAEYSCVAAVVESVRASGVEEALAAFISMNDLMVTANPVPDGAAEVVAVRVVGNGEVRIEHRAVTGRNDRIVRPEAEAVPLFWRFMIEKFGVNPAQSWDRE